MTKLQLIAKLSKRTGLEKEIVKAVLDTFSDEVSKQLIKGESVFMRGFCEFTIRPCAQRLGRNIKRRSPILIPAHDQPHFKPSMELKKKIKDKTLKNIVYPI